MKNKFVFILLFIMMLGVSPVFAAGASVENLDILEYQIFTKGCVGCEKGLELTSLEDKYVKELNGKTIECNIKEHEECEFVLTIKYASKKGEGLKFVYSSEDDLKADLEKYISTSTEGESDEDTKEIKKKHKELKNDKTSDYQANVKNELYKVVDIHGVNYYIYTGLLENNSFDRNLYVENGGVVSLLSFNKAEIDLYYGRNDDQRSMERVDETCQITNYYEDGTSNAVGPNTPNTHRYVLANEKAIFFVCNNCVKCQDCDKNVAVSGSSINDDIVLSKYCAVHTCAFIWSVEVANGSFEGLICKEKRSGTDYCDAHKCSCGEPIVGVNTNLILKSEDIVNHFVGNNEFAYSNYCAKHFCSELGCRNIRANTNAGKGYCAEHADLCSYPKCVNKITNKESGIRLCDTCKKNELKTTKCSTCGRTIYGDECFDCKFSSSIYDISVELQKEGVEVEGRKVPAEYIAWYSTDIQYDENVIVVALDAFSKCTHGTANHYEIIHNPGGTWYHIKYTICKTCGPLKSEQVNHTYSNGKCECGALEKDKVAEKTPCTGEHIWTTVYGSVPNFEGEEEFARKYHCVYKKCAICFITDGTVAYAEHGEMVVSENGNFKKCTICGYQRFIDYAPDGCCLNCGKENAGGTFCEECAKLGLTGNDAKNCITCGKRRIVNEAGVCKQCSKPQAPEVDANAELVIHPTTAIRINPIMSYNTCRHNHPIVGSVKFTKKSSSVHTQEWLCAGCNKSLSQDFNHVPLRNGKCICEI